MKIRPLVLLTLLLHVVLEIRFPVFCLAILLPAICESEHADHLASFNLQHAFAGVVPKLEISHRKTVLQL